MRQAELVLGDRERARPQARLLVRLELRQVEVRPGAALELLARVVEHRQTEVEERAADRAAVDLVVALDEVPAAHADHERRGLVVQPVLLLAGVELDRAPHGVVDVALPVAHVVPRRRVRVLEVRHEDLRARVEGVDHHLAVDRPGDLRPAVLEVGGRRGDGEVLRRPDEPRPQTTLLLAGGEQPLPLGIQFAMQAVDERKRLRREHIRLYANCASSVEPWRASVDESFETACITLSKYPAPTSRWCLVAV